ncbi:ABCA5 protein, partial [Galbula dea]|nr:ABCA5 protein [Galbula dea]
MCSAETVNCFPVIVNLLSNTFLRLFNSTARFRLWSQPFFRRPNPGARETIFYFSLNYMLILLAGLPSHFAVSSMEDYKVINSLC